MHILNGGQGPDREDARTSGQGKDQHESPPGGGGILPETQHPSGSAKRKEAETGNDLGSAREIGAPLMLIEPIGDQTIPRRRGEVGTCKIGGGATDDEPWTPLRKQERQKHDGNPDECLPNGAGKNEGFAIGEPLQQLHGGELGSCPNKLRQCRQHT